MDSTSPQFRLHQTCTDQESPFTRCYLNFHAMKNQRNPANCNHVTSLCRQMGLAKNIVRESLQGPLGTKIRACQGFKNMKCVTAWSKTSENFFGDDDDTLFESCHQDGFHFKEDGRIARIPKMPYTKPEQEGFTSPIKSLRWPLWLLGPSVLLTTGVIPTLWLPFVPLFEGSATAGLLALAGLDGIFNLGASMFILIADSCARNREGFGKNVNQQLPLGYKLWTFFVHMVGFLAPVVAFIASKRGFLGPQPALLPLSAMLAPYSALLLVHMFAEVLVWQWQSPVWAVLPLVYDCYSVLQLCRGLQLGVALGAPLWSIEAMKGLISWWVFVSGVHLMWIAWFFGSSQN